MANGINMYLMPQKFVSVPRNDMNVAQIIEIRQGLLFNESSGEFEVLSLP